jgi:hypothetical protein
MMRKQIWIVGRLSAMALQYHRTGDKRYIEATVKTIENMADWYAPRGLWQLWHGGYSTGIAINYDLLHNDMTPQQRQRVVSFARDHVIRPFLQRTGRGRNMKEHGEHGSWWQGIISNWNPVCNSGAGLLAIAMYDDLDEAQTVIDRVNASFDPIIEYLQETEGRVGRRPGLLELDDPLHVAVLHEPRASVRRGTRRLPLAGLSARR